MSLVITAATSPEVQIKNSAVANAVLTWASRAYVQDEFVTIDLVANWGSNTPTLAMMGAPVGGSGFSWVLIDEALLAVGGGGGPGCRVWGALIPSNQSFSIVQTTTNNSSNLSTRGMHRRWTGADLTTPTGDVDDYTSATVDPLVSASALDISVVAGSQICALGGDWNASTTITTSFDSSIARTEDYNVNESGQMHYVFIRSTSETPGIDASVRAGFDVSGGAGIWAAIIYEILAAAGAGVPDTIGAVMGMGS